MQLTACLNFIILTDCRRTGFSCDNNKTFNHLISIIYVAQDHDHMSGYIPGLPWFLQAEILSIIICGPSLW